MNNNYKQGLLLGTFSLYLVTLFSCVKRNTDSGNGSSSYILSNNADTTFNGNRTNDPTLKAITIPCQNNHTLRLYYSDSAATLGLPDSLTVVSYGKAGHLGYHECYIEATSSTYDTYLSTGSDHLKVAAGKGPIHIVDAILQHFTSAPQADSVTVNIYFAAE